MESTKGAALDTRQIAVSSLLRTWRADRLGGADSVLQVCQMQYAHDLPRLNNYLVDVFE